MNLSKLLKKLKSQLSKIFTIEGNGIHKYKIFGIGILDVLLTMILGLLTSKYLKINFIYAFTLWLVIGETIHIVLGIQTSLLKILQINLV